MFYNNVLCYHFCYLSLNFSAIFFYVLFFYFLFLFIFLITVSLMQSFSIYRNFRISTVLWVDKFRLIITFFRIFYFQKFVIQFLIHFVQSFFFFHVTTYVIPITYMTFKFSPLNNFYKKSTFIAFVTCVLFFFFLF